VLVAGGVGARALMEGPAVAPAAAVSEAPVVASTNPATPKAEQPAKKAAARAEKRTGGRVELAVAPWGEVLVDGKSRGVSPPLRVLEVVPGAHTVEIRNSTFPAHVEQVQLKAGEAVRIRHRFR